MEIVKRKPTDIPQAIFTTRYSTSSYLTPFNSEGLKVVLDEMTAEAAAVLVHAFIRPRGMRGKIESIPHCVCNKDGIHS